MIVLNKGSVHLDGSTIMLIAEMMTAIRSVRAIVEEDFGTDAAKQIIDKAVEIAKLNSSSIDMLDLGTALMSIIAGVENNGSK